ncbi:MAG: condensin complex protein MksE, partial [Bacteroidales bacterium]
RDGFIELENEIEGTYKVLSAFSYIEKLVLSINIPEEIINEIPE